MCPPTNLANPARSDATEEDGAPRKSYGVPEMSLIIGHTTDKSTWIWVRGSKKVRRLTVELHGVFDEGGKCSQSVKKEPVAVYPERDYTTVVRFESGLREDTSYDVVLTAANNRSVRGQLRTFPKAEHPKEFHFLHGSCNLPVDRMTALGGAAVGLIGGAATNKAFGLPVSRWDVQRAPRHLRWVSWPVIRHVSVPILKFAALAPGVAMYFTRFEQPKPLLPSPFEPILANSIRDEDAKRSNGQRKTTDADPPPRPAFMIHCGDQIYNDLDFPEPLGRVRDYRRSYRQSWLKDKHAAQVLRSFPHYMTLDDHEIVDNFGTDPTTAEREKELRQPALRAYDEYVASRQPSPPDGSNGHYYHFEHGNTGFFVLDTRTQRGAAKERMVSEEQLRALEKWLTDEPYDLRFIVSSVPFVAQVRPPGLDRNGERRGDGRADKWCGDAWKKQRDRIICAICAAGVDRLVFLVGDMHCTYHARMLIGDRRKRITVHELAGGPFNQLQFAKRDDCYARYTGEIEKPDGFRRAQSPHIPREALSFEHEKDALDVLPWTSTLESFHGAAPSVLKVSVTPEHGESPLEVRWTALRTSPAKVERERRVNFPDAVDPHDLCGRIRFHRRAKEAQ